MKKLILIFTIFLLVSNFAFALGGGTNLTLWKQSDYTGDTSAISTYFEANNRYCVNLTFSSDSTVIALNITSGSGITGGILQICEDASPGTNNACNCVANTISNFTVGGAKSFSAAGGNIVVMTDALTYTIVTTKKYWYRMGDEDEANTFGAGSWDTPGQSDIMHTAPNSVNFGTNTWDATTHRNWIYSIWNVIGDGASSDTTPPEINANSYNMTSEGGEGCINWRTNKSNPCSTGDTTPTVNFTTNEAAWCAIGTQDLNFSNYTRLAINRNCTIGQGTSSHTCTLVDEDELVYDASFIYLGCQDASNNSNLTSTSGALSLSITDLETAGRNSIGLGIQNALLNSYTNYTDLQIYARNLSNGQVRGTFDRAAKKGSRMWAFNRIGVSDSHVNMFNLTPVLYTLELANKTSSNITLEVEKLINATK